MKRSARKKLLGLTGLLAFSAVMMDPYDILRDEATLNDNCRYDWVESEVGVSSLGDPWTKAYEGRIEARIIEVEKDSNNRVLSFIAENKDCGRFVIDPNDTLDNNRVERTNVTVNMLPLLVLENWCVNFPVVRNLTYTGDRNNNPITDKDMDKIEIAGRHIHPYMKMKEESLFNGQGHFFYGVLHPDSMYFSSPTEGQCE